VSENLFELSGWNSMFCRLWAEIQGRIEDVTMTRWAGWIGACCLCLGIAGCGWISSEVAEHDLEDEIPDLQKTSSTTAKREATEQQLPKENLKLRLKVGDRFPLIKTVQQKLRQTAPGAARTSESSSLLTMKLAVTIEQIDQGVKTLGVRYQQVRYEHDIAGEKVVYDSALLPKSIPEAAQIYHGLVENGFTFQLGADNRIVQINDFEAFLKRCVRHVPAEQQQQVLTRLAETQEDEGIANFIDDSIGMLPYSVDDLNHGDAVTIGTSWRKRREVVRPIPMTIDTSYRLASLNERYATLELFGQIIPTQIQRVSQVTPQVSATERITLRGGHSIGSCTIDRESGLPIESQVMRILDLSLELAGGAKFDQRKEIITTIRAFPEQRSATAMPQANSSAAPATSDLRVMPVSSEASRSTAKITPNHAQDANSHFDRRATPTGFQE
jgi:hypothetical protein